MKRYLGHCVSLDPATASPSCRAVTLKAGGNDEFLSRRPIVAMSLVSHSSVTHADDGNVTRVKDGNIADVICLWRVTCSRPALARCLNWGA